MLLRLLVLLAFLYLSWIWIRAVIEGWTGAEKRRKRPTRPTSDSGRSGQAAEHLVPCQVCGVHVTESRLLPDAGRAAGAGWCSEACRQKSRIAS